MVAAPEPSAADGVRRDTEGAPGQSLMRLLEDRIAPFLAEAELTRTSSHLNELDDQLTSIEGFKKKLSLVHRYYCKRSKKSKTDCEMDIFEFFTLCKDCNLPKLGLSYQQFVQAFTLCNELEVEQFLQCELSAEGLKQSLSMELPELEMALCILSRSMNEVSRKLPRPVQIVEYILRNAPGDIKGL